MADEGFITRAEAEAAKETPILVQERPQQNYTVSPHFLENVRRHLEARYGARQLYESGLAVTTTLDVSLQRAANEAMARGLRRLDKRRGFRRPEQNVLADGKTIEEFRHSRWARAMRVGDVVPAVVVTLGDPAPATGARLQIGSRRADLTREGFAWTGRPSAASLFKTGDLIEVEITKLDEEAGVAEVRLEQTPLVEGALVAVENRTGHIKAMVGGWDFDRSKFNRAVQAYRQLGSTFKPIVYTAAIDRGLTPVTMIDDQPVSYPSGAGLYEPQNYDHKFEGPITLRRALEQSRNIPAIKMMETVGPSTVLAYAKRFGFSREYPPYLSIALGAGEATLLEVTSAYTVFPNRGVRAKPYFIQTVTDRDGNLLEEGRVDSVNVLRADTAFMMTSLLEGVVKRGTAGAAAALGWPLAGKTGTVDDNTDAWFVGFDPDITVGVWTGLDEKKTLGANETGAFAALPIWMDFMKAYIATRQAQPRRFEAPENIVVLPVDRATGTLTSSQNPGAIIETFIAGTQPGGFEGDR
jgi:penicillin-binding protein 1A